MLTGRSIKASMLTTAGPLASLTATDDDSYGSTLFTPTTPLPRSGWRALTTGVAEHTTDDSSDTATTWVITRTNPDWLERGDATDFEIQVTVSSSDTDGTLTGTTGSYLALGGVDREWYLTKNNNSVGSSQFVLDISIREIAVPANIVTGRITLTTTVFSGV